MAGPYPSLASSLHQALATIHQTSPRIIAAPPLSHSSVTVGATASSASSSSAAAAAARTGGGRGKRASVAIIVRIRPTTSPENDGGARRADYNDSQPPYTTSTSYSHDARSPSSPTLQNFQDSSLLRSRPQSSTSLSGGGAGSGFTAGGGSGLPQTTPAAVPSQPFFQQRQSSTSSSSAAPVDSSAAFAAPPSPTLTRLNDFFEQPWVRTGIPEILYIKRSKRLSDRWSSQVAFPGGRQEPEDENALYTALRETWEEVGIDLAEKNQFLEIGQLDDREITTSLGKRLLMVLSPFVFLHTSPEAPIPDIQVSEVASAHWVPINCLLSPHVRWGDVKIDITSRITPRNRMIRRLLALLTGNMHFKCILLPNDPIQVSPDASPPMTNARDDQPLHRGQTPLDPFDTSPERPPLQLWGLTLGMSLDLLSHMPLSGETWAQQHDTHYFLPHPKSPALPNLLSFAGAGGESREDGALHHHDLLLLEAPSMTSIFPTFSYPDVNFFIWLFGFRYRNIIKRWGARLAHLQQNQRLSRPPMPPTPMTPGLPGSASLSRTRSGSKGSNSTVNFTGIALNQFYAAVRKALVVAILLRATLLLGSIGAASLFAHRWLKQRQARLISGR